MFETDTLTFTGILVSLGTAIGLGCDAFAAAGAGGAAVKVLKPRHAAAFGLAFGAAQFIMPVIGYFLAGMVSDYVDRYGGIIACVVLCFIGGKMLYETFVTSNEDGCETASAKNPLGVKTLSVMAVATSIDALAVGAAFKLVDKPLWFNAAIIGIVAFAMSYAGAYLGRKMGEKLKDNAERAAGVVLIIIGLKLLIDTLLF